MSKTALQIAMQLPLTSEAVIALDWDVHPQDRTYAFHEMFGAPIYDKFPDRDFSHMDDQRVAFRAAFIMSEAMELLEKGLGLEVSLTVKCTESSSATAFNSDNAALTNAILAGMRHTGKRDVVEVVDALGDLNVVVNGFALELGVDMCGIDQEIMASNFTKLGNDGKPVVADGSDPKYPAGKILKGPDFIEPQIERLLGLAD